MGNHTKLGKYNALVQNHTNIFISVESYEYENLAF